MSHVIIFQLFMHNGSMSRFENSLFIFSVALLAALPSACKRKSETAKLGAALNMPMTAKRIQDIVPEDFPQKPLSPGFYKDVPLRLQGGLIEAWRRAPYDEAWEAADQAELVRPAPAGFKPEPVARKVKLTLIPKKTLFRRGEIFWYRLELQNVGRESIDFTQQESIFKSLGTWPGGYDFWLTEPDGHVVKLVEADAWGSGPDASLEEFRLLGWEHMTEADRAEAFKKQGRHDTWVRNRKFNVRVMLKPGDVLVSRAWSHKEDDNSVGAAPDDFRELWTQYKFSKPGTYKLKLVWDNSPSSPPNEARLRRMEKKGVSRKRTREFWAEINRERLGIVESNVVSFDLSRW